MKKILLLLLMLQVGNSVAQNQRGAIEWDQAHEILEAAFASCLNMSVRMHCDRLNIPSNLEVKYQNPIKQQFNCAQFEKRFQNK